MDRREFLRSVGAVAAGMSIGGKCLAGQHPSNDGRLLAAQETAPLRWVRVRGVRMRLSDWGDDYRDYAVELLVEAADERRVEEELHSGANLPADMWCAWGCLKADFTTWDGMEGLFHAAGRTYTARLVLLPIAWRRETVSWSCSADSWYSVAGHDGRLYGDGRVRRSVG